MHNPRIIIIVLNWNGRDDTLECLESVRKIDYPYFSTVVVDNGSSDDSVNSIKKRFPDVIVLETGQNLGFAAGNNVGMRYALDNGADFILLLNNDTVVDSQLLNNFMKAAESVEAGGIFGAKIYYFAKPDKIWYAGSKWIEKSQSFDHVGLNETDNGTAFNTITETDYACGCALLVRAEVLKKIGLLDERFFLIFEETDLCYRGKRAGYKCYLVPGAKVWHKISASIGGRQSSQYLYYLTRNRLLWAEKNLQFQDRVIMYMTVLSNIVKGMLPPRFHFNGFFNELSLRNIHAAFAEYRESAEKKLRDPVKKIMRRAVRDYCLRRFGNRPESFRSIEKQDR